MSGRIDLDCFGNNFCHKSLCGMIACGYSSGQTCQKQKNPAHAEVWLHREPTLFKEKVSMHWTMLSCIVTIVPHLLFSITILIFSHKIFPDDKACLEEYYVLSNTYLFTLLPAPLHYICYFVIII